MTANVLRDAEVTAPLKRVLQGGLQRYLDVVCDLLVEPFAVGGPGLERVRAAARAATDFHFWRALAPLQDEAAADLGAGLIELAASGKS